jgi:hypothetical protein
VTSNGRRKSSLVYNCLRYFSALLVITYGFAKLNGAQFTILESELDKPLREVSGFWLTWYYFGYSPFYGNLLGLVQVLAGALLLFRKTTLLATCILLVVISNIILIDICYAIDFGALLVAVLIDLCLIGIAIYHKDELIGLFWTTQNAQFPAHRVGTINQVLKMAARGLIIVIPAVFTFWVANYNNRLPTSIDGRWRVTSNSSSLATGAEPLTYIYFERNRAYLCVFRFGPKSWEWHHFEVDERTGKFEIWEQWLTKGRKIFTGRYELKDNKLTLKGVFTGSDVESSIDLEKPG